MQRVLSASGTSATRWTSVREPRGLNTSSGSWAATSTSTTITAAPDLWENDSSIYPQFDGEYLTDLITDRSIQFIERSAAARRPFFVDVAYNAPHWPYQAPGKPSPAPGTGVQQLPQQTNTATRADYGAMIESVDQGVGKILQTLQRLGLTTVSYTH